MNARTGTGRIRSVMDGATEHAAELPVGDTRRRLLTEASSALLAYARSPHTDGALALRAEHHLRLALGGLGVAREAVRAATEVDVARHRVAEHLAPDARLSLETIAADAGQYAAAAAAAYANDLEQLAGRSEAGGGTVTYLKTRARSLRACADEVGRTRVHLTEVERALWSLVRHTGPRVHERRRSRERGQ